MERNKNWNGSHRTESEGDGRQMQSLQRYSKNESFPVGKNRKHQIKSWSETAKGVDMRLQTNMAGIQIGPQATVRHIKKAHYEYTVVGPHTYHYYLLPAFRDCVGTGYSVLDSI